MKMILKASLVLCFGGILLVLLSRVMAPLRLSPGRSRSKGRHKLLCARLGEGGQEPVRGVGRVGGVQGRWHHDGVAEHTGSAVDTQVSNTALCVLGFNLAS